MARKILLFSGSLPPGTSGSAIIVSNLARQFGRDEMVVAGELAHGKPSVAWQADWPEIHYVYDAPSETARGFRWRRRLALPQMLGRSLALARREKCEAVVAVFPKEEHLLVGYLVAKRLGLKFYPYLHNTYLDQRKGAELKFARWFQPKVFAAADHVFVMSEGMVEFYREQYPALMSKCSALVHSFNEPLPEFVPPAPAGRPLNLVVSGQVAETCRDAVVRLCDVAGEMGNVRVTIFSGTSREQLQRIGLVRDYVSHEMVSRDVLMERLRAADILVLPHGLTGGLSDVEYRTIFPTKTIEYLITGKPILAHSTAGSFLSSFLRRHDCALMVEEPSKEKLRNAIEQLASDDELRARLVGNALRAAELFQAPRVAATLRDVVAR